MNAKNLIILIITLLASSCLNGCVTGEKQSSLASAETLKFTHSVPQAKIFSPQEAMNLAEEGKVVRDGKVVIDHEAAERFKLQQAEQAQIDREALIGNMPIIGATRSFPGHIDWVSFHDVVKEEKGLLKPLLVQMMGYYTARQNSDNFQHCKGQLINLQIMLEEIDASSAERCEQLMKSDFDSKKVLPSLKE